MLPALEHLFARYRSSGDPELLGAVFDRAAPRLLRTALHLARDPAEAEDVVQATFLTAIEKAGEWDAARPLLPWLSGILTRHVHKARAARGRRPEPARCRAPEPDDPAAAAERNEAVEILRSRVDLLPEVYRQALLLRLCHGLEPAEIAEVLGVPAGTVRMRLHRGADQLRRLLPAGIGLGVVAASLPARGLAAVRIAVLARAGLVPKAAVTATAATFGGALLMKKTMIAAAVLAVGVAALWSVLGGPAPDPSADGEAAPVRSALRADVEPARRPAAAAPLPIQRQPVTRKVEKPWPDPPTGSLRVRVVLDDGRPAPMVGLMVRARDGRDAVLHALSRATGADGSALFAAVAAGAVEVIPDRGTARVLRVAQGVVTEEVIELEHGVTVTGRVVDARENAVPFADLWVRANRADHVAMVVGRADAEGRFRLEGLQPQVSSVGAGKASFAPTGMEIVRGDPGAEQELVLWLREPGARVRGLVLGADGGPLGGARVRIGGRFGGPERRPTEDRWVKGWAPVIVTTDRTGRFAADGLPTGAVEFLLHAAGHITMSRHFELDADVDHDLTLRLDRGAGLRGQVRGPDGNPIAGASVTVEAFGYCQTVGTVSAADGRFDLRGLDPRRIKLSVWAEGYCRDDSEHACAPGETLELDVCLAPSRTLRGRVVGPDGEALARWLVLVEDRRRGAVACDGDGRFAVDVGSIARARLSVSAPAPYSFVPCGEVEVGEEEVLVRVPRGAMPTGSVRGKLLNENGEPLAKSTLRLERDGTHVASMRADPETGAFAFGPLPAGGYQLSCYPLSSREPPYRFGAVELQAHQDLDLGDVRLDGLSAPKVGFVAFRLRRTDGVPVEHGSVYLFDATGRELMSVFVSLLGRGRQSLVSGDYEMRTMSANAQWLRTRFTIAAGEDTILDLELAPATRRYLMFPWPVPDAIAHAEHVDYVLEDPRGAVLDHDRLEPGDIPYMYMPGFGLGRHRLVMTTDGGRRFVGTFEVASLEKSNVPIVVRVRSE